MRANEEGTTTTGTETFCIPVERIPELEQKLAKLNTKATKLGTEPITMVKGDTEARTVQDGNNDFGEPVSHEEIFQYITVSGEAPKLNGWQFVATLEHDEDGTIIRRIPTFEREVDLSAYRTATPENCDHCHTRRRRNDTYIVAKETLPPSERFPNGVAPSVENGTLKQVGSSCLKDFTGHQSPQQIARHMEAIRDLFEDLRGGETYGPRQIPRHSTHEFLTHVACMIRLHGWVSKREAYESEGWNVATAERASDNWDLARRRGSSMVHVQPTQEDADLARKAIEWAEGLDEDALKSDYLYTLHTVLKNGTCRASQFGIAASGIFSYLREQSRLADRQRPERKDEYAGEPKERKVFTFTVISAYINESEYIPGDTYTKHVLRDDEGRTLVWNASSQTLEIGKRYQGKFTIKSVYESSKYGKQTLITRPHGLEEL